jgi:hypothetical protein
MRKIEIPVTIDVHEYIKQLANNGGVSQKKVASDLLLEGIKSVSKQIKEARKPNPEPPDMEACSYHT